jgi:polysaccharide biosynthesis PFTS motif protein
MKILRYLMTNMICFLTNNFFIKHKRRNIRNYIRGYLTLKKSSQVNKIAETKRILSDTKLDINEENFSSFIIGTAIKSGDIEICIRQYLLLRVGAVGLNKALLTGISKKNKKIIYYIPKQWRKILTENEFKVADVRSEILWNCYLFALVLYGFTKLTTILLRGLSNTIRKRKKIEPYVYFINLSKGNIPKVKLNRQSYDVISWYINYKKNSKFKEIKHGVLESEKTIINNINVIAEDSGPIPDLFGWRNIFIFLTWGLISSILSIIDLCRGRWWHALILNQAILNKQVELTEPKNLAKEYLFHNTNQTYRPLWTYTAEQFGSLIILYFYSTNVENLTRSPTYFWRCMSWPRYLVWDRAQADFLKICVSNDVMIEIVGSIWFHDNGITSKTNLKKNNIVVFDVPPRRISSYCLFGDEIDYVVPQNCNQFLLDIWEISLEFNYQLLFKAKPQNKGSKLIHPHYTNTLNKISNKPNVSKIDPDVSPYDLIRNSSLVISFPFTATAIIARELGKPSCFYDPSNMISNSHHATHGITVINNKLMLRNWVLKKIKC